MDLFQASAKSTLLDSIMPGAIAELGVDVFNDLSPHGGGKVGRFEYARDQTCRETRFLVVPVHDGPGCAAWQPKCPRLLVQTLESCSSQCVADVSNPAEVFYLLGQDVHAKALMEKSLATADRGDRPISFPNFTAKAAMPARYVIDRGDWAGAAALELKPSQYPMADSLTHFTRGLGMARTGNLAGARAEIEAMKALRAALERVNDSYWADRTEEQMLAVTAWIAVKEGNRDQAVRFMRAAADNEDGSLKHIAMENRLYPLRELYGDLLFEAGDAAAALTEYETALKATPNRYRGILGVARAAAATGDRAKAAEYYGKLIDLAKNADVERQEVREAKRFLANK
jgi:tetratricopeptide (TPR) repeat protein